MKSVILVICLGCLYQVSLSQDWQQVDHPKFEDYYCIDTCNTDYGEGKELVRTQRSFLLKKLFKKWGKWFRDDCVECCQKNAGYSGGSAGDGDGKVVNPCNTNSYQTSNSHENSNGYENSNSNYGNYNNGQSYDNDGYDDQYKGPDIPINPSYGHLYIPLPHPHRVMTHLNGYLNNRPFRGGYSATNSQSNLYPPKEAYVDEVIPAAEPEVETNAADYETPAEVIEETDDNSYTIDDVIEENKNDYDSYSSYKENTKDAAPEVTKIIQPIVPLYIYPPNYSDGGFSDQKYSEGKPSYKGPSTESSSSYESSPTPYSSPPGSSNSYSSPTSMSSPPAQSYAIILISPATSSYSQSTQSYSPFSAIFSAPVYSYISPAASYSPAAPAYSSPASSYSPPAPSYSQQGQSYSAPASYRPPAPSYSPPYSPPIQVYSPPAPSYAPPSPSYSPPATSYSPPAPSYPPPSPSYSPPSSPTDYPATPPYPQPSPPESSYSNSLGPSMPYYKRTYSTTLTYEIPPCSPPSYENDYNMRSCPELFTSYNGSPMTPSSPY